MGRRKNILLIVLTAACVAIGALLPQGTASFQNQRLAQSSETQELDSVHLLIRQELSPAQMLALASGPYTRVAWDSGTNLTEEDVKDLLSWFLLDLVNAGLTPDNEAFWGDNRDWDVDAHTFLLISQQDNGASLLVWECIWENPGDAVYTVWFDDTTGLPCGVRRVARKSSRSNPTVQPEDGLVLWLEFLYNYYGLSELEHTVNDWEQGRNSVTLTLSPHGDLQDTCTITLTMGGKRFLFCHLMPSRCLGEAV